MSISINQYKSLRAPSPLGFGLWLVGRCLVLGGLLGLCWDFAGAVTDNRS
jgi:hypothetical protein